MSKTKCDIQHWPNKISCDKPVMEGIYCCGDDACIQATLREVNHRIKIVSTQREALVSESVWQQLQALQEEWDFLWEVKEKIDEVQHGTMRKQVA